MTEYEIIYKLLKKAGYSIFTDLQEKAFNEDMLYKKDKNIMITGSTASGKTLIPVLSYIYQCDRDIEAAPMLFAVPYKALALQKYEEIKSLCDSLKVDIEIQISSGDYKENDGDILASSYGNRIVVIIYEKLFLFSCIDKEFFNKYRICVFDEFGIVDSKQRGVKADFALLKALQADVKVILLTTPYISWQLYIDQFQFVQIMEVNRPVPLTEIPVFRSKSKKGIIVENENDLIQSCVSQRTITIGQIISELCEYCMERDMTVIVFKNNRTEIIRMACEVYQKLAEKGMVKTFSESQIEQYKQELLNEIYCHEEDLEGLFGISEYKMLESLLNRIAVHSASFPKEFREYIEHNWGKCDSKFKIVFSTETLAYGINSNADLVIISDMMKSTENGASFLNNNEYNNYIGRAGRMGKEGYAVAIINEDRQEDWCKMRLETLIARSQFFALEDGEKCFYLLSLFDKDKYIKYSDIEKWINKLPGAKDLPGQKKVDLEGMLDVLKRNNLIADADESFLEGEPCFRAKELGVACRGYVLSVENYRSIIKAVQTYCKKRPERYFRIIFDMSVNKNMLLMIQTAGIGGKRDTNKRWSKILDLLKKQSEQFMINFQQIEYYKQLGNAYVDQLSLAMGMYLWSNGESMKQIFHATGLTYGLIKKLGESMSYYLEIATTVAVHIAATIEQVNFLKCLQTSMYYGVPVNVLKLSEVDSIHPRDRYQYRIMRKILERDKCNERKKAHGNTMEEIKLHYDAKMLSKENQKRLKEMLGREDIWV